MTADSESPARATLIDYLRLFRIPNVFTSLSDVAMGYLFVASVASLPSLVCLLLASGLLYTSFKIIPAVYSKPEANSKQTRLGSDATDATNR